MVKENKLSNYSLEELFDAHDFLYYKEGLTESIRISAEESLKLIKEEIKSRPDVFEFMWNIIHGN